ncbi:PREDICTED: interleukin-17D [Galeopterus variegatus]|uniref:Interleukin-17D n=1 Tax=Galeopterus variegatus TaxID=482537 RepID=A0ABM0QU45_GALVR|nr:PREDICTED: interleukin-17D [Galeopterus variegatus]
MALRGSLDAERQPRAPQQISILLHVHQWAPLSPEHAPTLLSPCRISYDPARFPRYLPEAYCLCRGCLTGLFGEEDLRFRSAPVYMPAAVLRRTPACVGGRAVYTEHYVTIAVGCTCVPQQDKDAHSINSSIDKQGAKLLLGPNGEPARP